MFKKGSFEIGATVYPVAIKVPDLRGQLECPSGTAGHVEGQRKGRMVVSTGMWGEQKTSSQAQHTGF